MFGWCCRCHVEMDLAVARCPGEAMLGADRLDKCAAGYTGTTCNSCMDGFGMSSDRICEACEDSGYTVGSLLMLGGVIVGLILITFILSRFWKGLTIKHILRCAFQVFFPADQSESLCLSIRVTLTPGFLIYTHGDLRWCSQPIRILITYSQITSQLGDVILTMTPHHPRHRFDNCHKVP